MHLPLQVTFRDIPPTDALNNHIQKKADKLAQFAEHVISCHVVVEVQQNKQHKGKLYHVSLDLSVPHNEIIINKIYDEDLYVAIRDAFNAARRKLQEKHDIQRGEVKNHEMTTHGKVARIFPEEEFGFIESMDGRDFYFHRNNVAYPSFEQLEIGMAVQFLELPAADGLQANRVTAGKH